MDIPTRLTSSSNNLGNYTYANRGNYLTSTLLSSPDVPLDMHFSTRYDPWYYPSLPGYTPGNLAPT